MLLIPGLALLGPPPKPPTMVASAVSLSRPKSAIVTATASSKKLLAPMKEAGAATLCRSFQIQLHPQAIAKDKPLARRVMREVGIPLEGQYPKIYTKEMADKVYIVITMGYLDRCPYAPPEKTWDWSL